MKYPPVCFLYIFNGLKAQQFFIFQLARVQQELSQTLDRLSNSERGRQSAERQCKDLEVKLEELEAQGGKALKNQIKKLEQRVSIWKQQLRFW